MIQFFQLLLSIRNRLPYTPLHPSEAPHTKDVKNAEVKPRHALAGQELMEDGGGNPNEKADRKQRLSIREGLNVPIRGFVWNKTDTARSGRVKSTVGGWRRKPFQSSQYKNTMIFESSPSTTFKICN